ASCRHRLRCRAPVHGWPGRTNRINGCSAMEGNKQVPRNDMTNSPFPLEPTAADAQAAIADEFGFFGDWSERYQYLIDLGRKLPEFPDAWKTEEHRLLGRQSLVWIVVNDDAERLAFHSIIDSAI